MTEEFAKGLVYLVLTLFCIASVWIGVLHVKLSATSRENSRMRGANERLRRKIADMEAKIDAKEMPDKALLGELNDILDSI